MFALSWIPNFTTKEAAPALLQILLHGRGWLAPIGLLLARPQPSPAHDDGAQRARDAR